MAQELPTVRLFVPKFDRVVVVNQDDEPRYRVEFNARGEHEAAPVAAAAKPKPFMSKAEKEAAAAAEKEAAEREAAEKQAADVAKLASDAKP